MKNENQIQEYHLTDEQRSRLPEETVKQLETLFERMKNEILLPHKYYPSLEHYIGNHLEERFSENPETPLKDVVAMEIQELDPRIPPDKILELATFTIKKWQSLQKPSEASKPKPKSKVVRRTALAEAAAA